MLRPPRWRLPPGADLAIVINGTTVDSQYRQLNVVGLVDLTGVDLVLSGTHLPVLGQSFTIVSNDGTDAVTGTFNGLPVSPSSPTSSVPVWPRPSAMSVARGTTSC